MLYGGLPPIMNILSLEEKSNFLKSLFEETYISDIVGSSTGWIFIVRRLRYYAARFLLCLNFNYMKERQRESCRPRLVLIMPTPNAALCRTRQHQTAHKEPGVGEPHAGFWEGHTP